MAEWAASPTCQAWMDVGLQKSRGTLALPSRLTLFAPLRAPRLWGLYHAPPGRNQELQTCHGRGLQISPGKTYLHTFPSHLHPETRARAAVQLGMLSAADCLSEAFANLWRARGNHPRQGKLCKDTM